MKLKSPNKLNLLNFATLYDTSRAINSELDILPKEKVQIDTLPVNLDSSLALALSNQIFSDDTLKKLFGLENQDVNVDYFSMQKYVNKHFPKKSENVPVPDA